MITDPHIEKLITRFLLSEITSDEQETLDQWLSVSPEHHKEFETCKTLWKKSESLVFSGVINTEASLAVTKKRIFGINNNKRGRRWILYAGQAAAVILLSVLFSALYLYFSEKHEYTGKEMVYQEIKTAYGTQTKIVLDDKTVVWLNSGSTLRFPYAFDKQQERKVDLDGEAFFEVEGNINKPFVVHTTGLDVKVTGTVFNVSAYEKYNKVSVALMEGKVSLVRDYGERERELLSMNPGEIVEFDAENRKIYRSEIINENKYKGWKDGYIIFFDDPIEMVRQRLEKWYNVEIEIADPLLNNYRFTATFLDESLEQVLKLLSLSSPMAYRVIPAEKKVDNAYSMRKVILTVKK